VRRRLPLHLPTATGVPNVGAGYDGYMKLPLALMLAVTAATAADSLDIFDRVWSVPNRADWKVSEQDGSSVLHLVTSRGPMPGPRRPIQFALTNVPRYGRLSLEADVMPLGRSLMIVFAYRDEAHFDYAHLSVDTAAQQPVHNGIFHVYGGERVRISAEQGPAAFAASGRWFHVELTHDAGTGAVSVALDGKTVAALEAVDRSLGPGRVGLGSFDETAAFMKVKIRSTAP
jgi:hypothetical protein